MRHTALVLSTGARPRITAVAHATLEALETKCVHATFAVKCRPQLANILLHTARRRIVVVRVRIPARTRFISAHMAAAPSTVTFGGEWFRAERPRRRPTLRCQAVAPAVPRQQ